MASGGHSLSFSFLRSMLARSGDYRERACLTLTAIHPDGQHRTPSRHVPLNRSDLRVIAYGS